MQRISFKKTGIVGIFYESFTYFLLVLGIILLIFGYSSIETYFIKFTLNNKLTESALNKIAILKLGLRAIALVLLGIFAFSRYFKKELLRVINKRRILLQNIILFLFTIFITLLIVESAIRLVLPQEIKSYLSSSEIDFYEKYVVLNKNGYRDEDYTYEKGEGIFRIVVLGDSFTFGSRINNVDDTYPRKLESLLNENSRNVTYEVLNFGLDGIDTEYEIKILKDEAILYSPDIIILGYVLNDIRDVEFIKNKNRGFYLFWFNKILRSSSYLYALSEMGFNRAMEIFGFKEPYMAYIKKLFSSEKNKEFNRLYFKELNLIAKNENATLIVVIFPFLYQLDRYPFDDAHEFVKESSEENEFIVLDLLHYYQHYNENELHISRLNTHPNELGHKIASEAIYDQLVQENLIAKD